MPEGDTVHKLASYLKPRLVGGVIQAGVARASERVDLTGRRIESLSARGKHLFIELDNGRLLRSHLGMWGSWHRYGVAEPWKKPERQARIVLTVGATVYVCFNPKEVELVRARGVRRRVTKTIIGPDLLAGTMDLQQVLRRAREIPEPDAVVADLLLDQRIASGIGNVYKSEVLFLQRIDPHSTVAELSDNLLGGLYETARRLLEANLGAGPRVTTKADRTGSRLWVYGRGEQPCLVCGTEIRHARTGRDMRSTYWCPWCQPLP